VVVGRDVGLGERDTLLTREFGVARSTAYPYPQSLTQSGFIEAIEAEG
jgi:hypothetical protein